MVGRQHHDGVVPHAETVERGHQAAQFTVAPLDEADVTIPQCPEVGIRQFVAAVVRPVENLAAEELRIVRQRIVIADEERLVRVEALQMQEPVVDPGMLVHELDRAVETLRQREIAVFGQRAVVRVVRCLRIGVQRHVPLALDEPLLMLGEAWRDHRAPLVLLLSTDEFVAVIASVIAEAAILEVMIMVGDEMTVDLVASQHLGE